MGRMGDGGWGVGDGMGGGGGELCVDEEVVMGW